MTAQPAHPFEAVETEASTNPARPMLEAQLEMLLELARMGMSIARAITRQATEPDAPAVAPDVGLAYSRVSRAIRMTLALRAKLIEDLDELEAMAARRAGQAEDDRDRAEEADEAVSRDRVRRIVERVIEAQPQDFRDIERLRKEAEERLEDSELYGDMADRPFSEIVAQICQDLGVTPDWSRLAQEAWAREEMEHGPVGAHLARWMAGRDLGYPPPTDPPPSSPFPSSSGSSRGSNREDANAAIFDTT